MVTFIYLTASLQIQKHLYGLYDPARPDQQWDVYLSMKYTGPAYPFGESGEPNGLFMDRMILVKTDNEKQGMSK